MFSYGWWMCLSPVILEGPLVTEVDFFLRPYSLSAPFQGKLISTPWDTKFRAPSSKIKQLKTVWLLLKPVMEAAGKA